MRECEGLIDSLVYYIQGAIADHEPNDKVLFEMKSVFLGEIAKGTFFIFIYKSVFRNSCDVTAKLISGAFKTATKGESPVRSFLKYFYPAI